MVENWFNLHFAYRLIFLQSHYITTLLNLQANAVDIIKKDSWKNTSIIVHQSPHPYRPDPTDPFVSMSLMTAAAIMENDCLFGLLTSWFFFFVAASIWEIVRFPHYSNLRKIKCFYVHFVWGNSLFY